MNIFQTRPVQIDDFDHKLGGLDYFDDNLYLGDEKGNVFRYAVDTDQVQIVQRKLFQTNLGKGKVEMIKVLEYSRNLLILHDGALHYVEGKELNILKTIAKKNICSVELNKTIPNQIVIVDKREKKGYIHEFGTSFPYRYEGEIKRCNFPTLPAMIQLYDNFLFLAFPKRDYQIMDLNTYEVKPLEHIQTSGNVFVQVTGENEIVFQNQVGVGIAMTKEGHPVEKNSMNLYPNKQVLYCKIMSPYLIVAYEKQIKVYNLNNGQEMQEVDTTQGEQLKSLSSSGNKLFYGTQKDLIFMKSIPYKELILKCQMRGNIEEALNIFNSNVEKDDPEREKKLEQFYMDAAWSLIKNLSFEKSKNIITRNNLRIDIREVISLYKELLPQTKTVITNLQDIFSMEKMVSLDIENKHPNADRQQVMRMKEEKLINSRLFLADVLKTNRLLFNPTIRNVNQEMKEYLEFSHSDISINREVKEKISLEKYLEIIDFVLIKLYIKLGDDQQLKQIFIANEIKCQGLYQELQKEINQKFDQTKYFELFAHFHRAFGKIEEALSIYKKNGESPANANNKKVIQDCCKQTVQILKDVKEYKTLKTYYPWVLRKDMNIGATIFKEIPEDVSHPSNMLEYFFDEVFPHDNEQKQRKDLKKKYLEVIVKEKGIEDKGFHTQLAQSYISTLFEVYDREDKKNVDFRNPTVEEYRKKLNDFLRSTKAQYDEITILSEIRQSWLFDETIYLLGKLNRHEDAINLFIKSGQFKQVEIYCEEKNEKLLTKLFKIYVEEYEKARKRPNRERNEDNIFALKIRIQNLMKKYSTHDQLDQVEVLNLLPSDWKLADSGGEDGLYSFISSAISHTLHEKRSYQCAQNLSEMDLLNVEHSLVKAKQAWIKMTGDKKCAFDNTAISDKAFVVYPNGVVAKYTKVNNKLSQCPQTHQDFKKTYKGI